MSFFCYFFSKTKKKSSSVNFDAIIIYSFRFENDFSASGKPTLTWCVEIRNIVPYLQLFFFLFKIIYFYHVFLWKCKTTQRRTIIFFRCTKLITIRIYYGHMINNVSTVLLMKFFCSAFLHKHKACIYYIKKVIYFIEIVYTNTEVESYIVGSIGFISLQKKLLGISYFANIGIFLFFLIYFLYAYIYAM